MSQEQEFEGEIISLNKDTRSGRFRCKDGTEFSFAIADNVEVYELFGKKDIVIGGIALGATLKMSKE